MSDTERIFRRNRARTLARHSRYALACVLAFCLALLPIAPRIDSGEPAIEPTRAYAGPAEFLTEKLADETIDFVDDAIVSSLDYAAEKTGYNLFSKAADLLTLPSGKGDREIEKLCNEILSQLGAVDQDIKDLGDQLASEILKLGAVYSTDQWANDRRTLTEMAQKYTDAYNYYQHFLDATQNYSKAQESGDTQGAEGFKTKMEGYLQNFADSFDPTKTGDPISFESDIRKLASVCCETYPNYGVRSPTGSTLPQLYLLKEANGVCDQTQAYEHQKFATISAQANECMEAFAKLAYVNRLWVDYQTSLSPDGQAPAQYLTEQETVINETVQAINDLGAQAERYAGTLMRPYDFNVDVDMSYTERGSTHMYGHYLAFSRPIDLNLYAVWSRYTMSAYQGKALNGSTPFLLLKTDHGALVHRDLIVYERDTMPTPRGTNYWDYSTMNQDWYNLVSTYDSNYRLVEGAGDFATLVNPQSYALSGGHDLFSYLTGYGDMDASLLPPSSTTALIQKWYPADKTHDMSEHFDHPGMVGSWCFTYDYVADLTNYTLNQSSHELSNRVKNANTSPYHYDKNLYDQPMLVMLTGSSSQSHTIGIEQQPDASITVRDDNGNDIASGSHRRSSDKLSIILNAGDSFESLDLMDHRGNVLDTLLTADGFNLCADEHGLATLSTTMPYKDCVIRVTTKNSAPSETADESLCSIGGVVDGQTFAPGDPIVFSAEGANVEAGHAWGAARLRPSSWRIESLSDGGIVEVADGAWSAHPFEALLATGGLNEGMYRIVVTFARERSENGVWIDMGAPYCLGRSFTLASAPVEPEPAPGAPDNAGPTQGGSALAATGDPLPLVPLVGIGIFSLIACAATAFACARRNQPATRNDRRAARR